MRKRILWIDLLRIIGMVGVITIHIVGNTKETFGLLGEAKLVFTVIKKSFYFTIPLFVMVSGSMLLNKDIGYRDVLHKYVRRMLFVLLTFGSLFAFMEEYYINRVINFSLIINVFKRIINGELWAHMWYIYLMIALYLIAPILRNWVKNSNDKDQLVLLIILYAFTVFVKDIDGLFNLNIAFYIPISTGFVFAFLLGYYLYNISLSRNKYIYIYISGMVCFVIIVLLTVLGSYESLIGYTSTLCILEALSIYILIKNNFEDSNNDDLITELVFSLGKCSFGIYLIHQFFVNVIFKVLKIDIILKFPYVGLIFYVSLTLFVSYIVVYFMWKNDFIRKYLI